MMSLRGLTLRHWRRRPLRVLLTVLSVAIAVAAMLGTSMAQSMVRSAYRAMTAAVNGSPSLDVMPEQGGRFAVADLPKFDDLSGVRATLPLLFRSTLLRAKGQRARALTVGIDFTQSAATDELELDAGEFPREVRQVVVDASFAHALELSVGDRITLFGRRGPKSLTVSGLLSSKSFQELSEGATIALPLAEAQEIFELPGLIDRQRLLLTSEDERQRVSAAVQQRAGESFRVRAPLRAGGIAEETLRSTELALRFSTALSLVMSIFIVLNTLRMNFNERHKEFAILRALGASQKQIDWFLASEGLAVGVLGGILGVPIGVLLARGLGQVLGSLLSAEQPFVWPDWTTVLLSVLVGEAAVAAALAWTKWGGNEISPVEAMREMESAAAEAPPWRLFCVAMIGWCLSIVGLWLVRNESIDDLWTIPCGLLMLTSYVGTLPMLLPLLLRACRALLLRGSWLYRLLTTGQLERRPVRVGLTVGVLVVAISSGLGLGSAIISQIDDIRDWYRRTMSGDYFLFAATSADASAAEVEQLREDLRHVEGVAEVEAVRYVGARVGNEAAFCVIRDFPETLALPWASSLEQEQAVRRDLQAGQAVVSSVLANRQKIKIGDDLVVEISARTYTFRVTAIVNDYQFGGLAMFLNSSAAATQFPLTAPNLWIVKQSTDSVATRETTAKLAELAPSAGLSLQSLRDVRAHLDGILNGVVGALWTLIAVGFVVSGFGVANTLAMHVIEQTREIGLMRVVGMTQRQVRFTIILQAILLGVAGVLLGTLAGITTAAVIHWCGAPLTGRTLPFEVRLDLLAANAIGGLLITLVAALTPAWRASRIDLSTALAYE